MQHSVATCRRSVAKGDAFGVHWSYTPKAASKQVDDADTDHVHQGHAESYSLQLRSANRHGSVTEEGVHVSSTAASPEISSLCTPTLQPATGARTIFANQLSVQDSTRLTSPAVLLAGSSRSARCCAL